MRWANSSQLPLLLIMEASLSFELRHLWIPNVGETQLVGSSVCICFSGIMLGAPWKPSPPCFTPEGDMCESNWVYAKQEGRSKKHVEEPSLM